MTFLMPLLFVALSFIPLWLSTLNQGGVKKIAVIDNTGIYAPLFKSNQNYEFQVIDESQKEEYSKRIGDELFGILHITRNLSQYPKSVSILTEKQPPAELQSMIERTLSEKVVQQRLDALTASSDFNEEAVAEVRAIVEADNQVKLSIMKWSSDGSISESSTDMASVLGFVFTFVIYVFILMYGNMVMQSVLEEKKSRIVEVMVSSVKPVNMLIGKIVGIGLVGITQIIMWGVLIGIFSVMMLPFVTPGAADLEAASMMAPAMSGFDTSNIYTMLISIDWIEVVVFFILFFIGGYVLYASVFAMFASAVDSEEDTAQFMTPVTLIIVFAFMAGIYSVQNPDGPLAFWSSLIPFTSPIVMMMRIPFGVPVWEKLLSIVLLYGTFILISMLAAKIYRVGILMYGKKPSIKEMIKWVKYK